MKAEHQRIVDLASGWEESDAIVSVSPGDALLLASVGAPLQPGKRAIDPQTIKGRDLCAAAERLRLSDVKTPDGAQPTPNQQSISPEPVVPPNGPITSGEDNLEGLTVAQLRDIAVGRGVAIPANAVKAAIIDAIRKAPAK